METVYEIISNFFSLVSISMTLIVELKNTDNNTLNYRFLYKNVMSLY